MKPLVIYHANCADGFTAAWAVRQAMDAEFHPGVYGEAPPEVAGRDLILVDFCYPPHVMLALQLVARSILVLDHHKSADADLPDNPLIADDQLTVVRIEGFDRDGDPTWRHFQGWVEQDKCEGIPKAMIYALFDMERSGAGIAWDFFHPGKARPALIDHVEDRDLWRFALHGTREIQAAVFSHPYRFEVWDQLMEAPTFELYQQGLCIERKHHKDVAELVGVAKRQMVIGHYDVPVASLPYTLASDAGHLMAQGQPFAACYYDKAAGRVFSLRSTDDGVDVSEVAALYGGGGHARAAGFTVPRDHELARA
ncbi:DHHA1 domain-containing protein [Stenotrophomonas maltophilia]|uniref:Phosphohydrolase n=1 Tax=Stenotrophomonas maltophilia TaxID=40324 RepID=A0A4S2CXT4_STEMA|nr:DHHA1 domain-containing protein [Stenotrophomonas maltophilia]TGY32534.1 phosphohydrolase [Stenotrophomonas maltophilia]